MATILTFENNTIETIAQTFNQTEKTLKDNVAIIKKWFETQPHLPKIMGDNKIQNFLILNKGSIEKTKQKIEMYYTVRSNMTNMYGEINPKLAHMRNLLDAIYVAPHPKGLLQFIKLRDVRFLDDVDPRHGLGYMFNIYELLTEYHVCFGDIFIIDCTGLTQCILKVTPTMLSHSITTYKLFSARLIGAYLINLPMIGAKLLEAVKKVLKQKLIKRIHILRDQNELKEYLSEDMIPQDFGGKGPTLEDLQNLFKARMVEHQKFFDDLDKLKINEDLRPEELKNDEILGFYGNFKKLEID